MHRFPSVLATQTLQRFHGRLAAARRADPVLLDDATSPDDDLGQRPDEFPTLRQGDDIRPGRTPDEVRPPEPTQVPLPRHRDGVGRPDREARP